MLLVNILLLLPAQYILDAWLVRRVRVRSSGRLTQI